MCLPFDCVILLFGIFLKQIAWEVDVYQRLMPKDAYYSIIYNGEMF